MNVLSLKRTRRSFPRIGLAINLLMTLHSVAATSYVLKKRCQVKIRDLLSDAPPQVERLLTTDIRKDPKTLLTTNDDVPVTNGGEEVWRIWNLNQGAAVRDGYMHKCTIQCTGFEGHNDDDLYSQVQGMRSKFSTFWVNTILPWNMKLPENGQLKSWKPVVRQTIQEHYHTVSGKSGWEKTVEYDNDENYD